MHLTLMVAGATPKDKNVQRPMNAPHPCPRPGAGLFIGSLRSTITLGSVGAVSR